MPRSVKIIAHLLDSVIKSQKKELEKPDLSNNKLVWIKETAIALIELIHKKTSEFNSMNPYNKIVLNDYVSTLQTALNHILKQSVVKPKHQ